MEDNKKIPTYEDWLETKVQNEKLIKTNLIQIQMAEKILELCEEKLKILEITKNEK